MVDGRLLKSGTLDYPVDNDLEYPWSIRQRAKNVALDIIYLLEHLIISDKPIPKPCPIDTIVIEETNMAKARYSQKFLEFMHAFTLNELLDYKCFNSKYEYARPSVVYVNTSDWRRAIGISLSKEDKKLNAKLSKAKSLAKKNGEKLDKKKLGIKGKVNKKHKAVNYVNETFNLQLKVKDNNEAEAICMAHAYSKGVKVCDGK